MKLKRVEKTLAGWGLTLSRQQLQKLDRLIFILAQQGFPHSSIAHAEEAEIKHVIDSLACMRIWTPPPHASLLDVGSGSGFPGLVLNVAWPTTRVTLLDAVGKKIDHLRDISRALELDDVSTVHARAEDLGRESSYRESFDAVTARAVATTAVLAELCLPLVRLGGVWLLMKGPSGPQELDEARGVLATLGGQVEDDMCFDLPCEQGVRYLARIRKVDHTPTRYPRRAGKPQKRPLELP